MFLLCWLAAILLQENKSLGSAPRTSLAEKIVWNVTTIHHT